MTEVKLISSSHFLTGASKQLPQYLKSEQIVVGFYVCVGFTDSDFKPERLQVVNDTCEALAKQKGIDITAIYVDARPGTKISASKLR